MASRPRPGRGNSLVGTSTWHKTIRPMILQRDRNRCQLCHRQYPSAKLDVDHIMPRNRGGTDHPTNLRTLCRECHHALPAKLVKPSKPKPHSLGPVLLRRNGVSEYREDGKVRFVSRP